MNWNTFFFFLTLGPSSNTIIYEMSLDDLDGILNEGNSECRLFFSMDSNKK